MVGRWFEGVVVGVRWCLGRDRPLFLPLVPLLRLLASPRAGMLGGWVGGHLGRCIMPSCVPPLHPFLAPFAPGPQDSYQQEFVPKRQR